MSAPGSARSSAPRTVAIVGGGVAGAVTAIQLARAAAAPDVVLIDRAGSFARGLAYAPRSATHLLNVPAARMSVFADDPEHFLRWARHRLDADVAADAFLPRSLFGDYVAETLAAAVVRDDRRAIRLVRAGAVDVEPGSPAVVHCDDGTRVAADHVVIALGNGVPAPPPVADGGAFYASPRWIGDPWAAGALDAIATDEPVLLVGSGLTAYDVVLALRGRGHVGPLHVVSRRGLRPRAHSEAPLTVRPAPAPDHWLAVAPTLGALLRAIRTACAETEDWRAVMDSLRAVSGRLWQRLDARERRRFLARLRPYWDVHRHRAPLPVHRAIERLVGAGVLRMHAGRIRAWREDETGVTAVIDSSALRVDAGAARVDGATLRVDGATARVDGATLCVDGATLRVARVVNCTGPDTDVRRSRDPLVRALAARGLVVRDAFGLGVETSEEGALVDATGRPSATLSTLGTWRRPACWESVAVPELRVQAAALAWRLTESRALASAPAFPGKRRPGKHRRHTGAGSTVPVGCEAGNAS